MIPAPETENLEKLRFPIGQFDRTKPVSDADVQQCLSDIETHPALFRQALAGLTDTQLDTPYRPGGWTVRQVAHHLPESHMNAFIRIKLALTEDKPVIKPYDENAWSALPDDLSGPVEISVMLQENLHR